MMTEILLCIVHAMLSIMRTTMCHINHEKIDVRMMHATIMHCAFIVRSGMFHPTVVLCSEWALTIMEMTLSLFWFHRVNVVHKTYLVDNRMGRLSLKWPPVCLSLICLQALSSPCENLWESRHLNVAYSHSNVVNSQLTWVTCVFFIQYSMQVCKEFTKETHVKPLYNELNWGQSLVSDSSVQ